MRNLAKILLLNSVFMLTTCMSYRYTTIDPCFPKNKEKINISLSNKRTTSPEDSIYINSKNEINKNYHLGDDYDKINLRIKFMEF